MKTQILFPNDYNESKPNSKTVATINILFIPSSFPFTIHVYSYKLKQHNSIDYYAIELCCLVDVLNCNSVFFYPNFD